MPLMASVSNDPVGMGLFIACVAIVVLLVVLAGLRFVLLRSKGTPMLLRTLPAKGSHAWRHGIVRYTPETMEYFKLRSLRPGIDLSFPRLDIVVQDHRELDDVEATFMSEAGQVVIITCGGREYELAFDLHGAMAFNAWVESAPSPRKENIDFKALQGRVARQTRDGRRQR